MNGESGSTRGPRPESDAGRVPSPVFHALASPTRRALLDKLSSREQTVQRLAATSGLSVAAISQQLTVLRKAGLVTSRAAGRWRVYRLNAEPLRDVVGWLRKYERFWLGRLHALGQDVE